MDREAGSGVDAANVKHNKKNIQENKEGLGGERGREIDKVG